MITIINGFDLEATFKTILQNPTVPILTLPGRKDSLTIDYAEENGVIKDLSTPAYEPRTFTWKFLTYGATVEEIKQNFFGLFTALKGEGEYLFYNDYIDETLSVFFVKQEGTSPIQSDPAHGGVAITYTMTFSELNPEVNISDYFLVDDINRFLVP